MRRPRGRATLSVAPPLSKCASVTVAPDAQPLDPRWGSAAILRVVPMAQHILVVEDEPAIAESIQFALCREGFAVTLAHNLADARPLLEKVDLIVLDLMLPDGDGIELLQSLRQSGQSTAVLILSSRDAEPDRVSSLEMGADDYVTKPFSPREVVARVRAVLRRVATNERQTTERRLPPLSVDRLSRRARLGQSEMELTRVEFELLATMLDSPGRVFTREQLIDRVWGDRFALTDRTVDSHVKALRRKVAEAGGEPQWIQTVRGVGYRIAENAESEEVNAT
jgi:DNA-binding response OmpR family regulator